MQKMISISGGNPRRFNIKPTMHPGPSILLSVICTTEILRQLSVWRETLKPLSEDTKASEWGHGLLWSEDMGSSDLRTRLPLIWEHGHHRSGDTGAYDLRSPTTLIWGHWLPCSEDTGASDEAQRTPREKSCNEDVRDLNGLPIINKWNTH